MAICKNFGYPDLFLTITCNPNWPEFRRFTERERIPIADCPDIFSRVFHAKLKCLLSDLKKGVFFGPLSAVCILLSSKKRGLPHAHMLLWLNGENNLQSVEIVNEFICAKLPNALKFLALYNVVTKYMIHGLCSRIRPSSPCMKDVKINDVDIDNRFVVPYNPLLLMKYQAHINLEFCNKSNVIKYLFKYINKGPDQVTATAGEIYHVGESSQMLLNVQRGCTNFRSIRTVNGVTYDTFQEACSSMRFLIDDKEYVSAIKEVTEVASAA
ncbi:uncharacterized protein [Arachis hypogaea]|uniref:uncharacterized protein n=1 Tax=Arachis hypogaea TaxID=3818 RepID=UPI003B226CAC